MHEEGEDDHGGYGGTQPSCLAKHNAEDAAKGLDDPQAPQAAAHPEPVRDQVREYSAEWTWEDVHEPERWGDHSCRGQADVEAIIEILGDDVVDGEFHSETVTVGDQEHPCSVICYGVE